jgi:hypothetical protein
MADIHGSPADGGQMPQAPNSGPAPVPYRGPGQSPEPPVYAVDLGTLVDPAADLIAVNPPMPGLSEQPWAHDAAAGSADAPYYPGAVSPVFTGGDADAGGRDEVAGDVAGSVAAATARWRELQSDTYGQGGVIGDLMVLPPNPLDPGVGSLGVALPTGDFYDPPRDYTTGG